MGSCGTNRRALCGHLTLPSSSLCLVGLDARVFHAELSMHECQKLIDVFTSSDTRRSSSPSLPISKINIEHILPHHSLGICTRRFIPRERRVWSHILRQGMYVYRPPPFRTLLAVQIMGRFFFCEQWKGVSQLRV